LRKTIQKFNKSRFIKIFYIINLLMNRKINAQVNIQKYFSN